MKCEVQTIKALRYRMLKIEGQTYILDISQFIWNLVFPFLIWILPQTIYKVDGEDLNRKLNLPEAAKSKKKKNVSILFTAGIAIFLGNILTDLTDLFTIPSTVFVNKIIAVILLLVLILFQVLFNIKEKNYLFKKLEPKLLTRERIWLRPMSFKHCIYCLFLNFFSMLFFIGSVMIVLDITNILGIVSFLVMGLVFSFIHMLYVPIGQTTVRFMKNR
ncbi:DUF443 family protein [Bacillus lacus]|uniref:DUF443 family protein n=1 Tax=Metabacillus lacus TaxID=1983721 RepID=A0A7X2M0D5_9BACI|nr:DUF443 family protein [Metabacillus lacus]MRX72694.1 DUF443 family protein [Metabacillus lacus]